MIHTPAEQTFCHCTAPGWCARHSCHKPPHLFQLCRTTERYFRLWELGRGPGQPMTFNPSQSIVCRSRGEVIDEQECDSCSGRVRLKVFACAEHERCTVLRAVPDTACCRTCREFEPV